MFEKEHVYINTNLDNFLIILKDHKEKLMGTQLKMIILKMVI